MQLEGKDNLFKIQIKLSDSFRVIDKRSCVAMPYTDIVEEYDPELDSWTFIRRD